jgi:hypothetical protein
MTDVLHNKKDGLGKNMQLRKKKSNHVGLAFVLSLSVLTVIVVVGLVFPGMSVKEREAHDDFETIVRAFTQYRADIGSWPRHACQSPSSFSSAYLTGYSCMFDNVYEVQNWSGPYLSPTIPADAVFVPGEPGPGVDPVDPWGECYMIYRFKGGRFISIVSAGPDGTVNTDLGGIFAGEPVGDDLIITIGEE